MSQYDTPRQSRAGPQRSDSNARMHSLTKPYQRPAQRDQTDESGNRSPTKQPISTRPGLSKSASAYSLGTLTRSGSESSMLSGIKSLISRPLGWLTPARKSKKAEDVDAEMGPDSRPGTVRKRESPSPEQRSKKQRHYSPDHDMEGDYAPSRPNGLPSLGNVSLSRRATPNYSLPTSRSEAYLDMPQNMLQSTKRSAEHYSPWAKQHDGRTRSSITPANFRSVQSPHRTTLTRSATTAQFPRDTLPRSGSLAPSMDMDVDHSHAAYSRLSTPAPRAPLQWDNSSNAFTRVFASSQAPQVHQNEAERILAGLYADRGVNSSTPAVSTDMLGASSRELRKAIQVPMVARQTADRRRQERLGENHNPMISPYGRTQSVFREVQQKRREQTREPSIESVREPSPAPSATPRRSARNKRKESEQPTPKGKGKRAPSAQPEAPSRRTSERGSPPPTNRNSVPPPVPTITETAPSPTQPPTSGYRVLTAQEMQADKSKSSLRASSSHTTRQHHSNGISRNGSRTGSRLPSPDRSSGRFSAREEDLPDMDSLGKVSLPNFNAVSIDFAKPSSTLAKPKLTQPPLGPLARTRGMERRKSPLATQPSIIAQPDSPPKAPAPAPAPAAAPAPAPAPSVQGSDGFFGFGNKPAAPAPTNLFGAAGEKRPDLGIGRPPAPSTPFTFKEAVSTTPQAPPPSTFSFGVSTAPPPTLTVAKGGASGGSVFGGQAVDVEGLKASAPASGTVTPEPAKAFSFGKPADTDITKAPAPSFKFGATTSEPADPPKAPAFSFAANGTEKAAEPAKPASNFTFNKPASAAAPAFGSAATDKPATSTFTDKPAEVSAPKNVFGSASTAPSTGTPVDKPAPAFTFGASNPGTPTTENKSLPTFGFGAAAAPAFGSKPAETPAAGSKPADTPIFGSKPDTPAFGSKPADTPVFNSKPAETPAFSSKPAEAPAFGSKTVDTPAFGSKSDTPAFSSKPAETPASGFGSFGGFGAAKPAASTGPTFGAPAKPAENTSTFGGFGAAPKPAEAPKSFGFGTAPTAAAAAPATFAFGASQPTTSFGAAPASTFTFGADAKKPAPAPGFGTTTGSAFGSAQGSSGFGQPATATSTNGTAFGATNNTFGSTTQPAKGGFAFGASTNTGNTGNTPAFTFDSQPPTPATTTSTFNFAATPAPANQPFAFGSQPSSPAVQANTFQFGPTPTGAGPGGLARFGSPAGGMEGGFSLGVGGPAPASPSGRPIKPMRGARKK